MEEKYPSLAIERDFEFSWYDILLEIESCYFHCMCIKKEGREREGW